MDETDERRHFCEGPGIWDAACGVDGVYMTLHRSEVTCDDCKELLGLVDVWYGDRWDSKPLFAFDADVTIYWPKVRPCWEVSNADTPDGATPSSGGGRTEA